MTYLLGGERNNHRHTATVLYNQAVLHTPADAEIPAADILDVENRMVPVDSLVNQMSMVDILALDNQARVDMARVDRVVVVAKESALLSPNQVVGELHNWAAVDMIQLAVLIRKGEEWSHQD